MRGARRAVMALAGAGLLGLLGSGPAMAGTVEPLNQYEVSGKVDTDALARAGSTCARPVSPARRASSSSSRRRRRRRSWARPAPP